MSDELVEKVAEKLYNLREWNLTAWKAVSEQTKEKWRVEARVLISLIRNYGWKEITDDKLKLMGEIK